MLWLLGTAAGSHATQITPGWAQAQMDAARPCRPHESRCVLAQSVPVSVDILSLKLMT